MANLTLLLLLFLLIFSIKPSVGLLNIDCYTKNGETLIKDNSNILLQMENQIIVSCRHKVIINSTDGQFELNLKMNISEGTVHNEPVITGQLLNITGHDSEQSATGGTAAVVRSYQMTLTKSQLHLAAANSIHHHEEDGAEHEEEGKKDYEHSDDAGLSFHLKSYNCILYIEDTTAVDNLTSNNNKDLRQQLVILKFGLIELPTNYTSNDTLNCQHHQEISDQQLSPTSAPGYLMHRGPCDSDVIYLIPKNFSRCDNNGRCYSFSQRFSSIRLSDIQMTGSGLRVLTSRAFTCSVSTKHLGEGGISP